MATGPILERLRAAYYTGFHADTMAYEHTQYDRRDLAAYRLGVRDSAPDRRAETEAYLQESPP